ncbi:hypothetical protein PV05_06492 [Exophiala xenobiotica]|uniref:Uncharacterized protein n=1 Tax=Exophiala xenobiotica TaxID=348802 RepID=A0A0D2EF98_9EURO|nr:uncharacterized protein PV05_06492 [Exophiala xenobiotica]KIW54108.1 hypothetical protein PV05_06492 [Exophiala xenobiotica]
MIPPTPTSPTLPLPSPQSPRSTTVEPGSATLSPSRVTFFSSQQADTSTVPGHFVFPQAMASSPSWAPANHSVCRRNSLTTPVTSPQQASFMPTSPLFIRTPERAYFQASSTTALKSLEQDGRQSRMAMRSPNVDRVLNLPLRVNTSLYNGDALISEPMASISEHQDQDQDQNHQPSTPSSDATTLMDWSPTSPSSCSPSSSSSSSPSAYPKRIARPHVPTPILTRSPIRKRPRVRIHLPPPPRYHVVVSDKSLSPTSLRTRVQYMHSVEHLRAPLVPLISVTNGLPHPSFPTSLLQYHLLTHNQLDSMARWYHQVEPPVDETFMYPAWIPAWTSMHPSGAPRNAVLDEEAPGHHSAHDGDVDLETKRRRFGRFIGLRGCESPASTGPEGESPDELARRMEREWRRAIERADEDERAWEKSWRGRW